MGSFSIIHWLILILYLVVIGIPVSRILGRLGFSKWLTILAFIPVVNVVALWIFAFARWPRTVGD